MKRWQVIARCLGCIKRCETHGKNSEWLDRHTERLEEHAMDGAPSGSGVDSGTKLDEKSTQEKLVFNTAFHHMNEGGIDGWTEHQVVITPSLEFGMLLKVTGRDRNDIKDYLGDLYRGWLEQDIPEHPESWEGKRVL